MELISPAQCRAARGLLNWSQPDLAALCGIHVQTISSFELEASTPTKTTLEKILAAFENASIEFLPDSGLRKKAQNVTIYQGSKRFEDLFDDIYQVALKGGSDFCVANVSEATFIKWLANDAQGHKSRMADHAKESPEFKMRILIKQGDNFMPAKAYARYRWVKSNQFWEAPFYVYGDRLAILIFEENEPFACVVQNQRVADAYRAQFNMAWDLAMDPPKET